MSRIAILSGMAISLAGTTMMRLWLTGWNKEPLWASRRNETASKENPAPSRIPSREQIDGVPVPELLARMRTGDRDALGTIYLAYYPALCRLGALLTRSQTIAEEIVQDVFYSLWMRRDTIDVGTDLRVYLHGAVRNLASKSRRHERIVAETVEATMQERLDLAVVAQRTPQPDVAAEGAQFAVAYQHILRTLTERDRVALRLRWEEGFTFEQIAQVLSLSTVGARGVVLRAQQKVQDALAHFRA
jgi:RNA polymerase sigma factor (sigma-70 family)